jgi:hypothetical protein
MEGMILNAEPCPPTCSYSTIRGLRWRRQRGREREREGGRESERERESKGYVGVM